MSQFGYAEEQEENKVRPDIYAVISPPLLPPDIEHCSERTLLHVLQRNEHCCARGRVSSRVSVYLLYMNTT